MLKWRWPNGAEDEELLVAFAIIANDETLDVILLRTAILSRSETLPTTVTQAEA